MIKQHFRRSEIINIFKISKELSYIQDYFRHRQILFFHKYWKVKFTRLKNAIMAVVRPVRNINISTCASSAKRITGSKLPIAFIWLSSDRNKQFARNVCMRNTEDATPFFHFYTSWIYFIIFIKTIKRLSLLDFCMKY